LNGKSSITFVTDFIWAESYRFFFGSGTDLGYELALLPAVDRDGSAADGIERGGVRGGDCVVVRERVGGWRWALGASRQHLLLPLRGVEGARRVREDVRDAEVCVALVGNVLYAAEEQGFE